MFGHRALKERVLEVAEITEWSGMPSHVWQLQCKNTRTNMQTVEGKHRKVHKNTHRARVNICLEQVPVGLTPRVFSGPVWPTHTHQHTHTDNSIKVSR